MKILVINAGSSSLKYQLIDMGDESVLAKGICERIGAGGSITHKAAGFTDKREMDFPTHAEAFREVVRQLSEGEAAVISSMSEITAVGHRVVQGADIFGESVLLSDENLAKLEPLSDLAPLHNPAHLIAIRACIEVFGKDVPQAAVFDTSFHSTLPPKAYMFATPYEWYEKYRIRKYGFHGTSHRYVSGRYAKLCGRPAAELKIVTCHLGNGSSITAVNGGKSVDTSMGFTPLDGVVMGTRSGSIDPSIIGYICEKEGLSAQEAVSALNKRSGYLGISGKSGDQRDLYNASLEGDERCKLALDMQQYSVKRYIGAYAAAMGGLDAVIFTGGIGENAFVARAGAVMGLEFMGIELDAEKNASTQGAEAEISKPGSKVKVWVIPTNEELVIARDTVALIK
jgi:acetate kinase